MPTNFICFAQILFPVGLQLEVTHSVYTDDTTVPDTFINISSIKDIPFEKDDHIIIQSNNVRVTYKVLGYAV